ncbi:hypothetical protein EBZ39_09635 [bacterium]|nr:hypothetical protein [bacterium]
MALPVLDGNQTATTLSSVVTGGEHIVAHSVVSLGSIAISNITTAVSGSTVCVGNLGLLQSTVGTEGISASGNFIKIGGHTGSATTGNIVHVSSLGAMKVDGSSYTQPVSGVVSISNFPATQNVAGTVTANVDANSLVAALDAFGAGYTERFPVGIDQTGFGNVPISGTVTVGNSVTIGSCVTHGVTIANTSVTVNVNPQISFYNEETDSYAVRCSLAYLDGGDMLDVRESRPFPITVGNSVTIGSCVTHGVTIANTSVTVNGTFYQATQPVSLASVPTHGVTLASTTVTVSSLPALSAGTARSQLWQQERRRSAQSQHLSAGLFPSASPLLQ